MKDESSAFTMSWGISLYFREIIMCSSLFSAIIFQYISLTSFEALVKQYTISSESFLTYIGPCLILIPDQSFHKKEKVSHSKNYRFSKYNSRNIAENEEPF
ncbi:hypothetical protein K501DRAFT_269935 [Backusella circina FSU 941]|nr:hypothetical protein K501DRAFT_269935 [Backusella circina FSU 941]